MVDWEHDYKEYPELTNTELNEIGFTSPHIQITEDFHAIVVKVHDGDTVTLNCDFRDFDFPLRQAFVDAPELNTGEPGSAAKDWLEQEIEGEEVEIKIDRKNRVEKYGRLLGDIWFRGVSVGDTMIRLGLVSPFERRREGEIPVLDIIFNEQEWFSGAV